VSRHELVRLVPEKPTLLSRLLRSFRIGPLSIKDPALAKYFGGGSTSSGVSVSETSAMASSAVFSAVTMIADDIASLPLMLYKRLPDGGKDRYESHPLYSLLHDAPNPEMDAMVCWRTMQAHALIWQNAYAEIERDQAGRPVAIWPLIPERVALVREGSRVAYRVSNYENGRDVMIPAEDMIHLVGHSHDGSVGSSLVSLARESIALGLAAEKFGASFFGNGATFGGVLSFPGPRPPEMSEKGNRDELNARHQGVERAYKLLAIYNGAKYERVGVPPNEGQFNETRTFQIREVARWFKMPPHKLGDLADATYSNVEQMDAAYLSSCIRPWLTLWKQQLSRKLIARSERRLQFIEHDTHGFLSVDAQARAALYSSEFQVGSLTPNEIRGYENRDPIKGGERAFVQLNMVPLDLVDEWWEAEIETKKAAAERARRPDPVPVAPPPAQEPDPNDEADRAALRAAVDELKKALEHARESGRASSQRAEDLSGALAHMEERAEQLEANYTQALEQRDGATSSLAAEQAERVRERAESEATIERIEAEKRACVESSEAAHGSAHDAIMRATKAEADLAEALREAEGSKAAAESLRAACDAAVEREIAASEAFEEATSALRAMSADRDSQLSRAERAEQERAAAALALTAQSADYEERFSQLRAATTAAEAARDEAVSGLAAAQANEAKHLESAEQAQRDKAIAEHAQQAANDVAEAVRQREAKRLMDVMAAHRAIVVDTMARLITKETDRARRHQATPQKVRAWMDTFYDGHRDTVAEALLPIVRAQLAWSQSDADPLGAARALADAHVDESIKQLRDVLMVDQFTPTLETTLARWEQRRPDALADRLMREGVEYVRRQSS
jgi:HK97 family phage portal protein